MGPGESRIMSRRLEMNLVRTKDGSRRGTRIVSRIKTRSESRKGIRIVFRKETRRNFKKD